jgi:hypothetical protein
MWRQRGVWTRPGLHSKRALRARAFYSTPERYSVDKFRERRGSIDEGEHIEELPPPQHASIDFEVQPRRMFGSRTSNREWRSWLHIGRRLFAGLGADQSRCCLMTARQPGCAHALFKSAHPGFGFNPAASMPAIAQISSLSDVSPDTPIAPRTEVPFWIRTPPGTGTRRPCASAFTELMK